MRPAHLFIVGLVTALVATALPACGPKVASSRDCAEAADHILGIELERRLEQQLSEYAEARRAVMEPELRKALVSDPALSRSRDTQRAAFVARCEGRTPPEVIACILAATSREALGECPGLVLPEGPPVPSEEGETPDPPAEAVDAP